MKRWTVILTSFLLGGCTSMSAPKQSTEFQPKNPSTRQAQVSQITAWNAEGALSVQRSAQSPTIMRYQWDQNGPDHYQIVLSASLNVAQITITGQPGHFTLQRGNEPPQTASTPEQLMQKTLGWTLPVPSLWYWARGLPAPGASHGAQYDSYGHLTALQQNGWQVHFSDYHTVQGADLPQVIELQRQGVSAKIVVKKWVTRK